MLRRQYGFFIRYQTIVNVRTALLNRSAGITFRGRQARLDQRINERQTFGKTLLRQFLARHIGKNRTESGTYEVFHQLAMDSEKLGTRIELATSNPQIFTRVSTTQGAIGYVGLGFVTTGVEAVRYDNVLPTRTSIVNGTYKLSRPLFLFTNGYPELGSPLLAFCNFFLTEEGHEIISAIRRILLSLIKKAYPPYVYMAKREGECRFYMR